MNNASQSNTKTDDTKTQSDTDSIFGDSMNNTSKNEESIFGESMFSNTDGERSEQSNMSSGSKWKPCKPGQVRYYNTPKTPYGTNRCRNIESIRKDPIISKHLEYLKSLYYEEIGSVPVEEPSETETTGTTGSKSRKPCPPGQMRYYKTPKTPSGTNRCRKIDTIKSDPLTREHYSYLESLYKQELSGEPSEQLSNKSKSKTKKPCPPGQMRYYKTPKTPSGTNRCRKRETIKSDPLTREHYEYLDSLYKQEQSQPQEQLPQELGSDYEEGVKSMTMNNDSWKILGLKGGESISEIKSAYKSMALKWHPDKNYNSEESEMMFRKISEAYKKLTSQTGGSVFALFKSMFPSYQGGGGRRKRSSRRD
jgi:hypothetical protein